MRFDHPISYFSNPTPRDSLFSILIPSWNNLEMLKLCIASIQKNSSFTHQIIIHVNDGADGTLEWLKTQEFSYSISTENVGVCYAMNAMATLATTDYLLYINDDMYVCPLWDKILYEQIPKAGHKLFYYSATMIEPTFSRNQCAVAPHDFGHSPGDFEEAELLEFATQVIKNDWYGASWPPSVVHRETWDKVGGFSVEFSPGFGSDPDFSMKLWNLGVRDFRGFGKSLVYHFQSKSTGRVVKNDGRRDFAKKWGVTIRFFYRKVLCFGVVVDGRELKFTKGFSYYLARFKAWKIARG
mgnify:CR=1 FL=1